VRFAERGAYEADRFWEPVRAQDGHCVLEPESFYILASRERIVVPPDLAAEMLPIDVGIGELRNNYAGFFDNGFGWSDGRAGGTPAVLEVRAHDLPFLVEDGQVFFRSVAVDPGQRPRSRFRLKRLVDERPVPGDSHGDGPLERLPIQTVDDRHRSGRDL